MNDTPTRTLASSARVTLWLAIALVFVGASSSCVDETSEAPSSPAELGGASGAGGTGATSLTQRTVAGTAGVGAYTRSGGGAGAGGALGTTAASGGQSPARGASSAGNSSTIGGSTSSTAAGGQRALGGVGGANSASGGSNVGRGLTLYYIRHAEVVANTLEPSTITYENSETLTDLGVLQIAELTQYLLGMNLSPDAILVSPTRRTQKTIEAQNLTFRDPDATRYWQNDSYEAGLLMVHTAKDEILRQHGGSSKTIIVVGHASAGSVLINLLRGVDVSGGTGSTSPGALYLMNTGIQRIVQEPTRGTFTLEERNLNRPRTE